MALAAALVLSALLTAAALRSPDHHWVAWFCLLPLYQAIRRCRPVAAALAGGIWGAGLYFFTLTLPFATGSGISPAIGPSSHSLVGQVMPLLAPSLISLLLLAAIPAIYAGLGARLTRSIGFHPFILAVGWIGVELAFTPLGLPLGIMAGTGTGTGTSTGVATVAHVHHVFSSTHDGGILSQVPGEGLASQTQDGNVITQTQYGILSQVSGDGLNSQTKIGGALCHWIGHFLGYVFIAFLVAIANASLLAVLGSVRLSLPLRRILTALSNTATCLTPQTNVLIHSPALYQARPRAPPIFTARSDLWHRHLASVLTCTPLISAA